MYNIFLILAIPYIHGYKPSSYLDFKVLPTRIKETGFNIILSMGPAEWVFASVHYLVSNRNGLECGIIIADDRELLKGETKMIKINKILG